MGVACEHPDVAECAVIGIAARQGLGAGGFVVLKCRVPATLPTSRRDSLGVARRIVPVAAVKLESHVARLPKTRFRQISRAR